MEKKSFSLVLKTVEIQLVDKDGAKDYVIHELDGAKRDAYVRRAQQGLTIGPDGKPQGALRMDGLMTHLLGLCMTLDGQAVPEKVIQKWPATTVEALFNEARRLSALEDEEAEELGND